jgi:hypothetical protein
MLQLRIIISNSVVGSDSDSDSADADTDANVNADKADDTLPDIGTDDDR